MLPSIGTKIGCLPLKRSIPIPTNPKYKKVLTMAHVSHSSAMWLQTFGNLVCKRLRSVGTWENEHQLLVCPEKGRNKQTKNCSWLGQGKPEHNQWVCIKRRPQKNWLRGSLPVSTCKPTPTYRASEEKTKNQRRPTPTARAAAWRPRCASARGARARGAAPEWLTPTKAIPCRWLPKGKP